MTLSSLDILTILILLTDKHGILFHLFVSSSVSFIIVLFFSVQIFHFLVNFIHSYFIVFDAIIKKIIFIILFSLLLWMRLFLLFLFQMVLLLVYRNTTNFIHWFDILKLLNSFISYNSFWMESLGLHQRLCHQQRETVLLFPFWSGRLWVLFLAWLLCLRLLVIFEYSLVRTVILLLFLLLEEELSIFHCWLGI